MDLKENFLFKQKYFGFSLLFLLGIALCLSQIVMTFVVPQAIYETFLPPSFIGLPLMLVSGWIEAD